MGAFFAFRGARRPSDDHMLWTLTSAMQRQGFAKPDLVNFGDYFIGLFPRKNETETRLRQYPSNDFIALVGSIVFRGRRDLDALDLIFENIDRDEALLDDAIGHFTLIVGKAGTLRIVGDRVGALTVFHAEGVEALSSSFLALASVTPKLTLQRQSVFEFVLNGAVTGDDTLALEIRRLPRQAVALGTTSGIHIKPTTPRLPSIDRRPVKDLLADSHERLSTWFDNVVGHYGEAISCGVSAGYDSRLILAHLSRLGVAPKAIVYGQDDENVTIARRLTAALDMKLEVIDPDHSVAVDLDRFPETLADNFHQSDGYSYQGLFTGDLEESERRRRTMGGMAFLHGGGGEIFRDFIQFGDRPMSTRGFVQALFCKFDRQLCSSSFDYDIYLDGLVDKVHALIGDSSALLERHVAEWLYPNFRCRAWFGRDSSLCNRAGPHMLPFYELPITMHATGIPVTHKGSGAYQAALINLASPKAAAVMSQYGHDFTGSVPLKRRLRDRSVSMVPPALRPLAYQLRQRHGGSGNATSHLNSGLVRTVLPGKLICVDELFNVDKVTQPAQRSRLLGVEYLARHFESKLAMEGRAVEYAARREAMATMAWQHVRS